MRQWLVLILLHPLQGCKPHVLWTVQYRGKGGKQLWTRGDKEHTLFAHCLASTSDQRHGQRVLQMRQQPPGSLRVPAGAAEQDATCFWQQGQPPRSPTWEPSGTGQGWHMALAGHSTHRVQCHTHSSSPTSNTLTLDRISQEFRGRNPDTGGSWCCLLRRYLHLHWFLHDKFICWITSIES